MNRTLLLYMALQVPVFGAIELLFRQQPGYNPAIIPYDVRIYFEAATAVMAGQWPYRDFFFPYPPLSLGLFLPSALVSGSPGAFFSWFKLELLLIDWIGLIGTAWLARQIGQPMGRTLLVYTCALPTLGPIVSQRFDLVPAVLVVMAVVAWLRGWHGIGWGLLAAGTLTKAYPALLLPLFSIAAWRTAGWRAVWRGWIVFGLLTLGGLLPFLLVAPRETLGVLSAQSGRGLEIESTIALLLLLGHFLGLPAQVAYNQGPNTWEVTALKAHYWQFATFASQVVLRIRILALPPFSRAREGLTRVLCSSRDHSRTADQQGILSPIHALVVPLAFVCGERRSTWAALLFLFSALLTQAVYPFLWGALKQPAALPVAMLLLRDMALGCLCVLLLHHDA